MSLICDFLAGKFTRRDLAREEDLEREFVRQVCQDQCSIAFFYSLLCDQKVFPAKLQLMLSMSPPPIYDHDSMSKHNSLYYQALQTICGYYFKRLPPFDFSMYYITLLKEMWKLWNDSLAQQLSELVVPEKMVRTFLQNVVSCATSEPQLFTALYPRVKYLLETISVDSIVSELEMRCLDVLDEIDGEASMRFNPDWITAGNIASFWQNSTVLRSDEFGRNMQTVLAVRDPFPGPSQMLKADNLLTLANDVILKRRSFVDIIFRMSHSLLMAREHETLRKVVNTIQSLKSWIFLASFHAIAPDDDFVVEVLPIYDGGEWPLDMAERIRSDVALRRYLRRLTSKTSNEDSQETVPCMLQDVIDEVDIQEIHWLSAQKFLSFSDASREVDFGFVFAFKAVSLVLDMLKGGDWNEDVLQFCIHKATDLVGLVTDIFSLIFLKHQDKFIVSVANAMKILTALVPFHKENDALKYISVAFAKIQKMSILEATSLEDCFVSNAGTVMNALDNKEWELAIFSSPDGSKIREICQRAKMVNDQLMGLDTPVTDLAQLEFALSTNLGLCDVRTSVTEVRQIINSRDSQATADQEMDAIHCDSHVVSMLNSMESRVCDGYNVEIDDKNKHLKQFLDYYGKYTRAVEPSRRSSDIINSFFQSGIPKQWAEVEDMFGPDALEKVLCGCDISACPDALVDLIKQVSPVLGDTLHRMRLYSRGEHICLKCLLPYVKGDTALIELIQGDRSRGNSELYTAWESEDSRFLEILVEHCKQQNIVSEGLLFSILELGLHSGNLRENLGSSLFQAMFWCSPFPSEFCWELKMHIPDYFASNKHILMDKLDAYQFYGLFPEDTDNFTYLLLEKGISPGSPETVVEKLIKKQEVALACQYASIHGLSALFERELGNEARSMIERKEDTDALFRMERSFAFLIYNRLPEYMKTEEVHVAMFGIRQQHDVAILNDHVNLVDVDLSSAASILEFLKTNYRTLSDKTAANELVEKAAVRLIDNLSVNSPESEWQSLKVTRRLHEVLNTVHSDLSRQVFWLVSFLTNCFCARFGIHYCFLEAIERPEQLVDICWKYDAHSLIEDAKQVWPRLAQTEKLLASCHNCFMLGQTMSAIPLIEIQERETTKLSDLEETKRILLRLLPIEINYNPRIFHVEMVPMHYRVRCIINGSGVYINKDNFSIADRVISAFGGVPELLKFKCFSGDFNAVFKLISSTLTVEEWVNNVLCPVIGTNKWQEFWKFLDRNETAMLKFKAASSLLGQYLQQKKVLCTLFDIQVRLGMREDAILTCTEMGDVLESWQVWAKYAAELETLIANELADRKRGKRAQKVSDRTLNSLLKKTTLMKEFATNCVVCRLDFDKTLDLINSDKAIEPAAFAALYTHQFSLGVRICEVRPDALKTVCERLFDTLNCAGGDAIAKYVKAMGKAISGLEYEKLASYLTIAAESRLGSRKELAKFITSNIVNNDLQVKLLLKFGFLSEAKKMCQNRQLMFLVLNAAIEAGDTKLANECKKILGK